jgi:hypothetical protein
MKGMAVHRGLAKAAVRNDMIFILSHFMTDAQSQHLIAASYVALASLVFAFLAMVILSN